MCNVGDFLETSIEELNSMSQEEFDAFLVESNRRHGIKDRLLADFEIFLRKSGNRIKEKTWILTRDKDGFPGNEFFIWDDMPVMKESGEWDSDDSEALDLHEFFHCVSEKDLRDLMEPGSFKKIIVKTVTQIDFED